MGKEILTSGNTEIEKNNFCRHKTPTFGGICRCSESISI